MVPWPTGRGFVRELDRFPSPFYCDVIMSMPRTLRTWSKVIAVNVGLLVVLLVAVDLALGDWLGERNMGPVRVLRDVAMEFDVEGLYPGSGVSVYRRDHWGLRGAYDDLSRIDILTIGGSTTDLRLLGEGDTWQDRMGEAFHRDGLSVSVVNAGVDGQTTIGHIADFEHWFPKVPGLRARYVLAYVGLNDVHVEFHAWSDKMVPKGWSGDLRQAYRNNSIYYRAYRDLKGMFRARRARLIHHRLDLSTLPWSDTPMHTDHEARMAERLQAYETRLERLVELIHGFGARPILVTQPRGDVRRENGRLLGVIDGQSEIASIFTETNGIDRHIIQALFNRVTLEVCRRTADAVCVDLAGELEFEPGDFYDQVHYTPQGARRIGEYLAGRLRPYVAPPSS